jgi:hypothetical protein
MGILGFFWTGGYGQKYCRREDLFEINSDGLVVKLVL